MQSNEYAEKFYLGTARMTKNIFISELSQAIAGVNKIQVSKVNDVISNFPKPGEHAAIYWVQDSNNVVWY